MLNLASHTYRETRTSGVTEYLYKTGVALAQHAEAGKTIHWSTPAIPGYPRAYSAQWQRLEAIHQSSGGRCARAALACGAIALLGAEYERGEGYESDKTHGEQFRNEANRLISAAAQQAATCEVVTAQAAEFNTPQPQVAKPTPPSPKVVAFTLDTATLFPFDRSGMQDLNEQGRTALATFLNQLAPRFTRIDQIQIVGHADQLGDDEYNQRLSEARALSVREFVADHLNAKQVRYGHLSAEGRGSSEPVKSCSVSNQTELVACLAPNRRVQILVSGEGPETTPRAEVRHEAALR
jgi:outer membrane protein OmpA-like peptidoglycan-associated protein